MEKMVALLLIAYTIALWLGETLRETIFPKDSRKQKLYSGLFIFLRLQMNLSPLIFCMLSLMLFYPLIPASCLSDLMSELQLSVLENQTFI